MKNVLYVGAVAVAALIDARAARATPTWVSAGGIPGHTPSHIAVSSFDSPVLLTSDGWVYTGATGCSSGSTTICVPVTQWADTNGRNGTVIMRNINGQIGLQTSNNRIYLYGYFGTGSPQGTWYLQPAMQAPNGSPSCVQSFAMGPMIGTYFAYFPAGFVSHFWATDCGGQSVWQMNANMYAYDTGSGVQSYYASTQWNQLDTGGGDHGLALFNSVSGGELFQSPWFLSSHNIAYAWNADGNRVVEAGVPHDFWDGRKLAISFMTDHFVIASDSAYQAVYFWNGDITGHGVGTGETAADWKLIAFSPSGVTLKEIAWAPPYPAGTVNAPAAPGSRLWGLDTNGKLYTLADMDPVVPR